MIHDTLRHDIQPQDEEFFAKLKAYLDKSAQEAGAESAVCYPLKFNADGSLNREGTLDMAVYSGMSK